ncbi:MAG TPA: FAD-dependent oxidoreductase [Firmicutes bacterium]|nr:FAD-dependent oxidoreductase [Bacillota bacterium]
MMNSPEHTDLYDLVIIGAGPAGMTAAVYAARKGLQVLVISKDIGGQVNWTTLVENYMGFEEIQGPRLMEKFREQMQDEKVVYREDEVSQVQVQMQRKAESVFAVTGRKSGTQYGRAVIIATGKRPRSLGVPGEEKFRGKGVSFCSTCDAPLFRDAVVAVVGGGNSGAQAVIDLLGVNARQVNLITEFDLTADQVLLERVLKDERVEVYRYHQVKEIMGDRMVQGLRVVDRSGETRDLPVAGVFIEIGLEPNTEFLDILDKSAHGEVLVDCHCRTNIRGIFAAGDATIIPEKQIIIAAGEGAKAAIQAWKYLMRQSPANEGTGGSLVSAGI